jgi:hypothetical protein
LYSPSYLTPLAHIKTPRPQATSAAISTPNTFAIAHHPTKKPLSVSAEQLS